MDLGQLARVIASHKRIAALGVLAAFALAFLAYVRVDPLGHPTFTYRKPNEWASTVTLQLTQSSFPEGRIVDQGIRDSLVQLAPLYAQLVDTTPVRQRAARSGPLVGVLTASPRTDEHRFSLPLIDITATATSGLDAQNRARRQAAAFMAYITQQQRSNHVRPSNRVILRTVSRSPQPVVVAPRKKTLPVVIFLSMVVLTMGTILATENLRGRARGGRQSEPVPRPPSEVPRPPLEALAGSQASDGARSVDGSPAVATSAPKVSRQTVASPTALAARRTLGSESAPSSGVSPPRPEGASTDVDNSNGEAPNAAKAQRASRNQPNG